MTQIWVNGRISIKDLVGQEREKFIQDAIASLLYIVKKRVNPAFDPKTAEIFIAPHLTLASAAKPVAFDCWFDCGAEYYRKAKEVFELAFSMKEYQEYFQQYFIVLEIRIPEFGKIQFPPSS